MSTYEPPLPPEQQPPSDGYGAPPPPPPPPAPPQGGGGYSAGTAWSFGWNKFTGNLGSIVIAVLVLVAVQVVVQVVSYFVGDSLILRWVISLAGWVLSMIIGAGLVRAALDITEGRELDPKTLLTPNKLGEVIVASLLISVATFVGLILCVIPGLLVAFFTSFTLYFLMDRQELGAIDAIKASFEFTKNNAGNVIVWFLLCLATYIVGFLLCGVGLIAAIPVILIGTAYTYKTLNGQAVAA
ncbi:hypothetical protein KM427_04540 [Nocardioides sp. LMS-CY]|uniref:hypothetical protein n=1 Tax=Nocardioides sp. (strain LMS-CY) TaxID=2840457 RepID=UPI001C002EFA|nr:hypothetical protein [Nocardioides sp. LMS-CY]QWF23008.1 hypothetical protein KM427_04540 [Nocardioides sp. LMS-CY]